jgi:ribonuclease P protein component
VIWRIRERAAFGRFRSDGRRYRHEPLWLTWIDDPAANPPRVGFAVGRAIGPAVTRNRLRRRLRAILQELDRTSGPLPAGWYLLGGAPSAASTSFSSLSVAVESLVSQVRASAVRP